MWKLTEEQISRINSYEQELSNNDVAKMMGINRKTVAKYRIRDTVQKEASDVLTGNEEKMWLKKKTEPQVSKGDKKKLELLEHYSPKDVQEMLNYIAMNTKKEIDKTIWEPGHL